MFTGTFPSYLSFQKRFNTYSASWRRPGLRAIAPGKTWHFTWQALHVRLTLSRIQRVDRRPRSISHPVECIAPHRRPGSATLEGCSRQRGYATVVCSEDFGLVPGGNAQSLLLSDSDRISVGCWALQELVVEAAKRQRVRHSVIGSYILV